MCAQVPRLIALACLSLSLAASAAPANVLPEIVRKPQRGIFLVAAKSLHDPNFSRSVVLLTEHANQGSIGLIVNKTTTVSVVSTLPEFDDLADPEAKIRFGGPVQIQSVRLLVSTATEIPSAERLFADVYFVNNTTTLQLLLADDDAAAINYYAGFSGWSSGQLETEIARGDWHLIKAGSEAIFEQDSANIWLKLIERLEGTWVLINNAVIADTRL
jgi:putative transcriptional regulator